MSHASFKTAGWRSCGRQLRRRLFVPLCLLALIHSSLLSFPASAAETPMAEGAVAVGDEVTSAKEPPAVEKEGGLGGPEGEENLLVELPLPTTEQKNPNTQRIRLIKAGALLASVILLLFFFVRKVGELGVSASWRRFEYQGKLGIKSHEAEREAMEAERKKSLEMAQDLRKFATSLTDLKAELVEGNTMLANTSERVKALISQIDGKIATIESLQQKLASQAEE